MDNNVVNFTEVVNKPAVLSLLLTFTLDSWNKERDTVNSSIFAHFSI